MSAERKRATELLQLTDFILKEGVDLIESGDSSAKKTLRTELGVHVHLLKKTLDVVERYARRT